MHHGVKDPVQGQMREITQNKGFVPGRFGIFGSPRQVQGCFARPCRVRTVQHPGHAPEPGAGKVKERIRDDRPQKEKQRGVLDADRDGRAFSCVKQAAGKPEMGVFLGHRHSL